MNNEEWEERELTRAVAELVRKHYARTGKEPPTAGDALKKLAELVVRPFAAPGGWSMPRVLVFIVGTDLLAEIQDRNR